MKIRMTLTVLSLLAAVSFSAGGAFASDSLPAGNGGTVEIPNQVATSAQPVKKPDHSARLRAEEEQLQKMINATQSGKQLQPSDIDRAVERSNQGF